MTSCAVTEPDAAVDIAAPLLAWYTRHGRHDLPWQHAPTPYRVWVSEIMLQQTQVATVVPYYARFMQRFPDLGALADAAEDDVLHHWSGLGYYSRARNLHRAARRIRDAHGGMFPRELDALESLPGVGRSTAGAILALAHGVRAPILDGNVRRVLSRVFAIDTPRAAAVTERRLWSLAEQLTPADRFGEYTQAIMDLGATLCTRSRPRCGSCPLRQNCRAQAAGNPAHYPARAPRRATPERRCRLLVIRNPRGEFLLEKRPPSGIWGGLWSFPQIDVDQDPVPSCERISGETPRRCEPAEPFVHTFSHFRLLAEPVILHVAGSDARVMEAGALAWYKPGIDALGLAAPVTRLIDALSTQDPARASP